LSLCFVESGGMWECCCGWWRVGWEIDEGRKTDGED
jgi:hypothetical protein